MSNEMIERAVKALELANEKPRYLTKFDVGKNLWFVGNINGTMEYYDYDNNNHDDCENICEALNNRHTVVEIIKSLKGEVPYYNSEKHWSELTSTDVWNLCLDKLLSVE